MTRDEIISMAHEVWPTPAILPILELVQFARLVAKAEREACAKVCDQTATYPSSLWEEAGCWNHAAECCASAIRAQGDACS